MGSITKNNKRVDFTKIHLIQSVKKICQDMQLLECTQECVNQNIFDPIKDGTLRAASPKTIGV